MLRRYYQSVGHRLEFFGWGRNVVGHIRRHSVFYENFEALFTALLLALIIKRYIVEAYKIPSRSMMNTLLVNDRIFVNKFCYLFQDIKPGDIVVFRVPTDIPNYDPEKPYYIKRVVGVAGDQIEVDSDHHIYRNGQVLVDPPFFDQNPYYTIMNKKSLSMKVPDDHILVFGDNSGDSYDGRYWGPLPIENVMGKAFFRYWPVHPWRVGPIQDVSVNPRHPS